MEQHQDKVIIVTGGNKGIGLALVTKLVQAYPKYKIILTAKDPSLGEKARQSIVAQHPSSQNNLFVHKLDITDSKSRDNFFNEIKEKYQHIDILVNNAAVSQCNNGGINTYDAIIGTNYHATVDLTNKLVPLLSDDGRILMVSSDLGQLSYQPSAMRKFLDSPLTLEQIENKLKELRKESLEGRKENLASLYPLYGSSKAFLNAYVRWVLASKMKVGQSCVALHPGWCNTELSNYGGPKSPEEGTKTALFLIGLSDEKARDVNGKFFNDNAKISGF